MVLLLNECKEWQGVETNLLFIKKEKGQALLEFTLALPFIMLFLVGIIDYSITYHKVKEVDRYANYYLDRTRMQGYLTPVDRSELINKVEQLGFTNVEVIAPNEGSKVTRSITADLDDQLIALTVNYSAQDCFAMGLFLQEGENSLNGSKTVRGFSEYAE